MFHVGQSVYYGPKFIPATVLVAEDGYYAVKLDNGVEVEPVKSGEMCTDLPAEVILKKGTLSGRQWQKVFDRIAKFEKEHILLGQLEVRAANLNNGKYVKGAAVMNWDKLSAEIKVKYIAVALGKTPMILFNEFY